MKIFALLLLIPLVINYIPENDVYEGGCRYNIQGWIYVHIEGDAYERGFQHGYLLYAEIIDMIYRWSNIIHNCPIIIKYLPANSSDYEKLSERWWNSCKKWAMKIFWDNYPEEFKEEIKGIADGVRARNGRIYGKPVSYEDILTLNEMYELMSMLTNPQKGFHIARDILYGIVPLGRGEIANSFSFVHHCNGFAAVGNATKDGKIVISDSVWCGGWWYSYYIAQRWNVILDIEPSRGHRIIIATSPGYIWSDEDYWQNDAGLAMVETTFIQGLWKTKGIPLAIRARMAMQYGNNIDDVINYLLTGNTGVMNSQWLIADAEAGEIALLEFGLYEYNVIRKKNGFLWSANNPIDFRVRREILRGETLKAPIFRLAHLILNATGYQYYTLFYTPSERDIKFKELGKKYYGEIDVEVVKEIMSTPPITDFTTDCKITDGNMIWKNGLWAFWGNPHYVWNTSHLYKLRGVKDVPPAGWVKVYGVPYDFKPNYEKGKRGFGGTARVLWEYEIGDMNYDFVNLATDGSTLYAYSGNRIYAIDGWETSVDEKIRDVEVGDDIYVITDNHIYHISREDGSLIQKEEVEYFVRNESLCCDEWEFKTNGSIEKFAVGKDAIYFGSWDGNLYCIDKDGNLKWKYRTGWGIVTKPCVEDAIYFGSLDGNFYCIDKDGNLKWVFTCNASIHSDAVCYGEYVFFGSDDGRIYALNRTNGEPEWSFSPSYEMEGIYNYITTPILSNIVAHDGKIFFSGNGKIYCLDAQTYEVEEEEKERRNGISLILIAGIAILAIIGMKLARRQ